MWLSLVRTPKFGGAYASVVDQLRMEEGEIVVTLRIPSGQHNSPSIRTRADPIGTAAEQIFPLVFRSLATNRCSLLSLIASLALTDEGVASQWSGYTQQVIAEGSVTLTLC